MKDKISKMKIENVENAIEQVVPKKVKREFKRHYLLYIIGSLLILGIAGYFTYTYAQNAKKSRALLQQQVELQQEQIKKLEQTPNPTPTPQPSTQAKTTTQKATVNTCKFANPTASLQFYETEIATDQSNINSFKQSLADYQDMLSKDNKLMEDWISKGLSTDSLKISIDEINQEIALNEKWISKTQDDITQTTKDKDYILSTCFANK